MKQFFTLARIAGACMAQALSGALVMKRLIVVAMLAGLMTSAAYGQTIAQQRAAVTQQQAAVALKSSQEYLRAAGWQFQAMTPDGSTWTHSDYVGTVTLAKDGWLVLANDQKVRPERVALYLKGLEEAAAVPAPSAPAPAQAPEPRETTSYRPHPTPDFVPDPDPAPAREPHDAEWCAAFAKLTRVVAEARDKGVPESLELSVMGNACRRDGQSEKDCALMAALIVKVYESREVSPDKFGAYAMIGCMKGG